MSETSKLARMLPTDEQVQALHRHAEMLALVRPHFVASWITRSNLLIDDVQLANARADDGFLQLLEGDRVLAFALTKLRGWGRHAVALTTSSVHWRIGDQRGGLGFSDIDPSSVRALGCDLQIGQLRILLDETDAPCFAEAIRSCVSYVTARPGPPVCRCGAPSH